MSIFTNLSWDEDIVFNLALECSISDIKISLSIMLNETPNDSSEDNTDISTINKLEIIISVLTGNTYILDCLFNNPIFYSTEADLHKSWTEAIILFPPTGMLDQFIEKLKNSPDVHHILLINSKITKFDYNTIDWTFTFPILFNNEDYETYYIYQK